MVCLNYFRAIVMSAYGIGSGDDAAWYVKSISGGRMVMIRERDMRLMTESDVTDANLRD